MNIREYYSFMIKIYVNQVIIVGVFTTICLILFLNLGRTTLLKAILCIFCTLLIYLFIKYLYFKHQESKASSKNLAETPNIRQSNRLLLLFLPAPSLKVKFFKSDGICEWELSDEKIMKWKWFVPPAWDEWANQSYILKKRDGSKLASFKISNKSKCSAIITLQNESIFLSQIKKQRKKHVFTDNNHEFSVRKKSSSIEIYKDEQKISTIEKGWMPINWQKHFSPNTPIMELNENLNNRDPYIILYFIIYLFANHRN